MKTLLTTFFLAIVALLLAVPTVAQLPGPVSYTHLTLPTIYSV